MEHESPSPQDPARFSKPKSDPPILDLKADTATPRTEAEPSAKPQAAASAHETLHLKAASRPWFSISGFVSGLAGGALITLLILLYAAWTNSGPQKLTNLQKALATKAEQSALTENSDRITALEAGLADVKAALANVAATPGAPDAALTQRIADLEAMIHAEKAAPAQATLTQDKSALRLTLLLSLRDALRNDLPPENMIAALDASGETENAFQTLKTDLAKPLVSYDELHSEVIAQLKTPSIANDAKSEQPANSRLSAFFSQWVTVRPASSQGPKISSTDISFTPLLEALDQNSAGDALHALASLPNDERARFKDVEVELQRHSDADAIVARLIDSTLLSIASGKTP